MRGRKLASRKTGGKSCARCAVWSPSKRAERDMEAGAANPLTLAARRARIPAQFTSLGRRRCERAALAYQRAESCHRDRMFACARVSHGAWRSGASTGPQSFPACLSTGGRLDGCCGSVPARTTTTTETTTPRHTTQHDTTRSAHGATSPVRVDYLHTVRSTCTCTGEVIAASSDAGSS